MSLAAADFLAALAAEHGFHVDVTDDAGAVSSGNLERYDVFLMLHLAPFEMTAAQQEALRQFIEGGRGWVGLHAAGLAGREFIAPETPYWQWFEDLLGGITYIPHPAYQRGTVVIEDRDHPATRRVPDRFEMSDEWYEFSANPRGRVHVLATADESTYTQNRPMGDHPIVWTNEDYRRAIYIGVGHDPSALENTAFATLLCDALLWAGS